MNELPYLITQPQGSPFTVSYSEPDSTIFRAYMPNKDEVVRIENDGRIFWKGREVETDDEFRAAMMAVGKVLQRIYS